MLPCLGFAIHQSRAITRHTMSRAMHQRQWHNPCECNPCCSKASAQTERENKSTCKAAGSSSFLQWFGRCVSCHPSLCFPSHLSNILGVFWQWLSTGIETISWRHRKKRRKQLWECCMFFKTNWCHHLSKPVINQGPSSGPSYENTEVGVCCIQCSPRFKADYNFWIPQNVNAGQSSYLGIRTRVDSLDLEYVCIFIFSGRHLLILVRSAQQHTNTQICTLVQK